MHSSYCRYWCVKECWVVANSLSPQFLDGFNLQVFENCPQKDAQALTAHWVLMQPSEYLQGTLQRLCISPSWWQGWVTDTSGIPVHHPGTPDAPPFTHLRLAGACKAAGLNPLVWKLTWFIRYLTLCWALSVVQNISEAVKLLVMSLFNLFS